MKIMRGGNLGRLSVLRFVIPVAFSEFWILATFFIVGLDFLTLALSYLTYEIC